MKFVCSSDSECMLGRYTKCSNWLHTILKTTAYMAVLNHPPNMHSLIQKLPNNLQTKWCNNIVKSRRKHGKIAGFGDLTNLWSMLQNLRSIQSIVKIHLVTQRQNQVQQKTSQTTLPTSKLNSTSFTSNLDVPTRSPS